MAWWHSAFVHADTIVAVTIPLVAVSLLAEAYWRTEYGDAQSPSECQNSQTTRSIQPHHVRELETSGIVVIPNFLSLAELSSARRDIAALQAGGTEAPCFAASANNASVRQDLIQWIEEDSPVVSPNDDEATESKRTIGFGLSRCVRLLRGIPHALQQHAYADKNYNDHQTAEQQEWKVPRQCQLAWYPGNRQAAYQRHLDRCTASFQELGLLEWWRLSDYRERYLTTILYLNSPDRPITQGGALRCWVAAAESTSTVDDDNGPSFGEPFDIQPRGGTLVIFKSGIVDHQVLPSSSDRLALTNWVGSVSSTP